MKISIKVLNGNKFDIEVQPTDTVLNIKKQIQRLKAAQTYPTEQQLLIYQGKVLRDEITLQETKVAENSFLVVMLSKTKPSTAGTSVIQQPFEAQLPSSPTVGTGTTHIHVNSNNQTASTPPATATATAQAGSNVVQLNLFPQVLPSFPTGARAAATSDARPNAVQGLGPHMRSGGGVLTNAQLLVEVVDFLRSSPQFQVLRPMVQDNPQILEPMLQNLGKKRPRVMEVINDNLADILRLVSEPVKRAKRDDNNQLAGTMPQATNLSPEQCEAVKRLKAMGFERARVMQVFLACDKNEELALKYLLDGAGDHNGNDQ